MLKVHFSKSITNFSILNKYGSNYPYILTLQHLKCKSSMAVMGKEVKKHVDKSRLLKQHYNVLHNEVPYAEPELWIHFTEKYGRKLIGTFGAKCGINPRVCYPSKHYLDPYKTNTSNVEPTVSQIREKLSAEATEKLNQTLNRELDIKRKLSALEAWKSELNQKKAKKEADALAAIARKERLIQEVRQHFGFKIDPQDERFKELLKQKEKEENKKQKESKRKAKEENMMSKIAEKFKEP